MKPNVYIFYDDSLRSEQKCQMQAFYIQSKLVKSRNKLLEMKCIRDRSFFSRKTKDKKFRLF